MARSLLSPVGIDVKNMVVMLAVPRVMAREEQFVEELVRKHEKICNNPDCGAVAAMKKLTERMTDPREVVALLNMIVEMDADPDMSETEKAEVWLMGLMEIARVRAGEADDFDDDFGDD